MSIQGQSNQIRQMAVDANFGIEYCWALIHRVELIDFGFGCHFHAGGFLVLVKVGLEGEGFAATLAREWLQIGMSLNVGA